MRVVVTVDQRGSRSGDDRVPELLGALEPMTGRSGMLRGFQRTAGDEVQAVLGDAETVDQVLHLIMRTGGWSTGLGVGPVEEPLPSDARAGRGPAYVFARQAVTRAKSTPHHVVVVGGDHYRAEQLETVLWLWAGIVDRRTPRGWEVADVLADGASHVAAGRRLGISQSAVSQRAQAAGLLDEHRARRLATQLLGDWLVSTA